MVTTNCFVARSASFYSSDFFMAILSVGSLLRSGTHHPCFESAQKLTHRNSIRKKYLPEEKPLFAQHSPSSSHLIYCASVIPSPCQPSTHSHYPLLRVLSRLISVGISGKEGVPCTYSYGRLCHADKDWSG